MIVYNKEETIFVEKYRPVNIDDIILDSDLKEKFQQFIKDKDFPHLLFWGTAGVGKSTTAKALCNQLEKEFIFINASLDSNVDVLKDKIQHFARTMTIGNGKKVVILDEIDGVRSAGFFDGLRPVIERFSSNCVFIFTCNYIDKVPDPIRSRTLEYEFTIRDKKSYCIGVMKRVCEILDNEKIQYDKKIIAEIIKQKFPDVRRIINAIQNNKNLLCDSNVLYRLEGPDVKILIDYMKDRDAKNIRQYIVDNFNIVDTIYSQLFDRFKDFVEPASIPAAILVTDDFMRSHSQCIDKVIHVMAYVIELTNNITFKK